MATMIATVSRGTTASAGVATRAIRDAWPLAAAVVPFGVVVGVAQAEVGPTGLAGVLATAVLFAGSAHLAVLTAVAAGGGVLGAVLAGVAVNARLLLYSAAHGHRFRADQPVWFRWLGALLTVDQSFALTAAAPELRGAAFRRYWGVVGSTLLTVWTAAVAVGLEFGGILPEHGPVDAAVPATLVSLLVMLCTDRRAVRVAVVAGAVAVVAAGLPGGVGIVLAIGAGLAVAGPSQEPS